MRYTVCQHGQGQGAPIAATHDSRYYDLGEQGRGAAIFLDLGFSLPGPETCG